MRQKRALFGMTEETSDKNEAGNWYKGGEAPAYAMMVLATSTRLMLAGLG